MAAHILCEDYKISERRACRLLTLSKNTKRYSKQQDYLSLVQKIKELASQRRRFGYRRLQQMLERDGVRMNHKKFRRIYKEQKLEIKNRKKIKVKSIARAPIAAPTGPNQRW